MKLCVLLQLLHEPHGVVESFLAQFPVGLDRMRHMVSHVLTCGGVEGNDRADRLAKEGAESSQSSTSLDAKKIGFYVAGEWNSVPVAHEVLCPSVYVSSVSYESRDVSARGGDSNVRRAVVSLAG
jgi:hypothetical protein